MNQLRISYLEKALGGSSSGPLAPLFYIIDSRRDGLKESRRLTGTRWVVLSISLMPLKMQVILGGPARLSHGRCGEGHREASGRLLEAFLFRMQTAPFNRTLKASNQIEAA